MARGDQSFTARIEIPAGLGLIGLVVDRDGREDTWFFAGEDPAAASVPGSETDDPMRFIGIWADLDWETMAESLDRIRHDSPPSLPIEV